MFIYSFIIAIMFHFSLCEPWYDHKIIACIVNKEKNKICNSIVAKSNLLITACSCVTSIDTHIPKPTRDIMAITEQGDSVIESVHIHPKCKEMRKGLFAYDYSLVKLRYPLNILTNVSITRQPIFSAMQRYEDKFQEVDKTCFVLSSGGRPLRVKYQTVRRRTIHRCFQMIGNFCYDLIKFQLEYETCLKQIHPYLNEYLYCFSGQYTPAIGSALVCSTGIVWGMTVHSVQESGQTYLIVLKLFRVQDEVLLSKAMTFYTLNTVLITLVHVILCLTGVTTKIVSTILC